MFGGDLESVFQPIFTLGLGGLIGAVLVLSVALSVFYIIYLQSKRDHSDH